MTDKVFNNISIRLVGDDETPISKAFAQRCFFFESALPFQLDRVVAPAAPRLKKDDTIGRLWDDIAPINGGFQIDLAAQLPYYLPRFAGLPDYSVQIGETELFVSTRMIRCFFQEPASSEEVSPVRDGPDKAQPGAGSNSQLKYWLVHRRGLDSLVEQRELRQFHPVPVGTFVAKGFLARGESAESVIQENLYGWVQGIAKDVSELLEAIRTTNPEKCKSLPPVVTVRSFPTYFLVVSGADNRRGFDQFAPESNQFGFRSLTELDKSELRTVQEYLSSDRSIPIELRAIGLARTFLHQGHPDLALIEVCIACEAVLARRYRDFLLARGVTKNKYKDCERDITFSHLLNIHLPTMVNIRTLEDHDEILAHLNWARRCRNEVVHGGRSASTVSSGKVGAAIDAVCRLVGFLSDHP